MKSLCIAGSVRQDLVSISQTLEIAGIPRAHAGSPKDESMSIHDWQSKVIGTRKSEKTEQITRSEISRMWEQHACEIYFSNAKRPMWHWADTRSAYLLEFWHSFDPNIYFILLQATPHSHLTEAIKRGVATQEGLHAALDDWYSHTRLTLQFHLRYPERSVLLNSCVLYTQSNASYLEHLAQRWQLPINTAVQQSEQRCPEDKLTGYLLHQFVQERTEILSLYTDVRNLLAHKNGINSPRDDISSPEKALIEHVEMTNSLASIRAEYATLLKNMTRERANSKIDKEQSAREREKLLAEKKDLLRELDTLIARHTAERADDKRTMGIAQHENRGLLLQLHQTQEALAQYILKLRETRTIVDEEKTRARRFLERYPNYWDYGSLQVKPLNSEGDKATLWHLTDVLLGNRRISDLRFKLRIESGMAGIFILRSRKQGLTSPLLRWPEAFTDADELPCIPRTGHATSEDNLALSSLGPTDWDMLQCLINHLIDALSFPAQNGIPDSLDLPVLRKGLVAFQNALKTWPLVLRYDKLIFREERQEKDYESITISLEKIFVGENSWQEIEYCLASAGSSNGPFGASPRLEFPERARSALYNWFPESDDERGPRLELRFALPDSMDMRVWNALSGKDQLLISGLVSSFPLQLADIQKNLSVPRRPWQDWLFLCASIRQILAANVKPTRHNAHITSRNETRYTYD